MTAKLCVLAMLFFFSGQINAQTATLSATGPELIGLTNGATASLTASSVGTIPAGSTIDDVEINIDITHTWVGDLDATLTSPDGTVISLFDRPGNPTTFFGCANDNMNVDLSDGAANTAADLEATCNSSFTGAGNPGPPYAISGAFQTLDAFATLVGESAVGDWTLEVTDNAAFDGGFLESFELTVAFTAPPCVFNCPSNMIINLDPGACSQVISYDADPVAGCLSVNQTAGLPSGSEFPIGTTTQTFVYTDAAGGTQTCSFDITVNEYVPTNNSITCNSLVHISLDENCQAAVGADQILEGNNYGCYDNYTVTFEEGPLAGQPLILGPGNVGQTIKVRVTNPQGIPCWGYILVEDKIAPTIVCYDAELACDEALPTEPAPGTSLTGNFATISEGGNGGGVGGTVYFDITNSTSNPIDVNFDMNITAGSVVDVYIAAGSFNGNVNNAAAWTLLGTLDATAGPFSGPFPGNGTLTPALGSVSIPSGTHGIALNTPTAAHNYTNGDGTNETFSDGVVTLQAGAASNGLFAAGNFNPRVFNGAVNYSQIIPQVIPSDGCGPVTVTFEDATQTLTCSPTNDVLEIITRTWTATDLSGNSSTCVSTYTRKAALLEDVIFPADVTIDCSQNENDLLPNGTLASGEPTGVGCNLDATKEDLIIGICTGSYKVLRTWTVVDWCTNTIEEETQIIKVLDTTGPNLVCPADLTIGTTSNACSGNVALPAIVPTDNCSSVNLPVQLSASAGTLTYNAFNDTWTLTGLPLGTHQVTYTATDDCGNESTCVQNITVEDNIAPIAICDEFTIVSIGTNGDSQVAAHTFDDGSLDNCGIVEYKARRMDNPNCPGFDGTAFGDYVPFYCCDLGSTVMVEFQVRDAAGNTNSCMVEVEVQDKLDPVIVCPAPKTINCDDDALNLGLTGEAVATDNCSDVTPSFTDISNTVDCGEGTILRLWTVSDDAGNSSSCIQTITVVKLDPFTITDTECRTFPLGASHTLSDDVEWPCDVELTTCGLGLSPDDLEAAGNPDARPTIFEGACDNVAMTHQDTELEFGAGDACLKILRKWIIIDWCQANANQDPTQPGPGVWHYVQVIKVINSNDPIITPVSLPAIIENYEENCGTTFAAFEITADDDCTAQSDLDVTWAFSSGATGTGFSATDNLVNGSYSVTFTVNDQCGNEAELVHNFEVIDAKKPTPICTYGISTVTMPNSGAVSLSVLHFEQGSSYDNCTPYNALLFSFSPDVNDTDIVITCADIPADGLVPITVYATDAAGNQDFCTTFVKVESAPGVCPNQATTISGVIENENQEVVEEVTVTLSDNNGMNLPVVTGTNGAFDFGMSYGQYDVTPEKDINHLNGVTTYDLVLISKHILGLELLNSPYKWIAADANNSQTITTLDIVKLRALILHIDDELANNTSWRFVDANHVFTTANPLAEQFNEYVALDGTTIAPVNFTAVKIGDVNGTATPNNLLGTDTRTFNGKLALQLDATKVAAEETFTVDFRAKDFNNIAGYQFTLGFDNNKVEFVDVVSNLAELSAENFGLTKLNEGVITTSWNSNKGVSMDDDAVLFSMTFVANAAVNVEDVLSINSRYTQAEAYNGSDLLDVVLEFNGSEVSNGFELYQNTPNPFKAETTIGFNLTEAGTVTLRIYDVAGRTLRMIEMDAAKGFNSVNINRADLDATGVLYYQLETANETATKKMIIVD